jgi:hypothetical protein
VHITFRADNFWPLDHRDRGFHKWGKRMSLTAEQLSAFKSRGHEQCRPAYISSNLLRLKSFKVWYLIVPEFFELVTKYDFFLKSWSKSLLHIKNRNQQGHHVGFLNQAFFVVPRK